MKRTYLNNAEAQNKGVRANILYGNILDQQRYFFVLPHVRNKKILDCACGVGWGSYVMSMSGAEKITSFDISQNAISAASKFYSRPNIKYICSDFLNPTYDFEKVDIITSFETIEPAHKGNCYPAPVTSGMEPAYHYFILRPISD